LQAEKNVTHTGCGEGGHEREVAVGLAVLRADTIVTAREENANPARAEERELPAHGPRISLRDVPLKAGVRRADRLRDEVLAVYKGESGEVWVILPCASVVVDNWLGGCCPGCFHRR
jgi:hypothetical protein